MKLLYCKMGVPNFGDDLNEFLWPHFAPGLFDDSSDAGFVGIGTIIGRDFGHIQRLHVFSSGVGNDRPSNWSAKEVIYECVRGPISARLLNLPPEKAVTDGAILTPLVPGFPSAATGGNATLVIPHWQTMDYPGWTEAARLAGFELLDPRNDPKVVIQRIAASKLVLTESLHGAVLADTYGIPWRAFATSRNFAITKCADWASSLGRSFDLTMVPPPDVKTLMTFGKCVAPFGETVSFGVQTGLEALNPRLDSTRPRGFSPIQFMRSAGKFGLEKSQSLRSLMGFNAERTADALTKLARMDAVVTPPALIAELQSRLMDHLSDLARRQGINISRPTIVSNTAV